MDEALRAQIARREATEDAVKRTLIEALRLPYAPEAMDVDVALFGTGLALDSVDAMELVVAVETRFDVRVPQGEFRTSLRTLGTLVDLVLELRPEASP